MAHLKDILAPKALYGQNLPALAGGFLPAYIAAFLVGVFVYFKLPLEPQLSYVLPALAAFIAVGIIALFKSERIGWPIFLSTLWCAVLLGGISYATWHTNTLKTAFWPENQKRTVWLNGTVEKLNAKASGFTTATLNNVTTMDGNTPQHWEQMIVSAHTSRFEGATTGTEVAAQVRLSPPAKPLHPSMYDWQMRSYFEGVAATGLVMGGLYLTEPEAPALQARFNTLRYDVFNRITNTAKPGSGVGAALLTGLRGGIAPEVADDFRQSGLAHLMAISGMHLGMLSGAVYFLLLFIFVRCGKLPYKADVRKLAALGALTAAAGYTLMAGATVPTLRAFCLIVAAFFALLSGRIHLGVRILALVALAVVLYKPYLILTASFQLSFVTALALVVWAYVRQTQRIDLGELTPKPNRFWQSVQVSIVATLATLPFIALHFKQVATIGVLANVVAIPLMAFVVLPLGFSYLMMGKYVGSWLLDAYLFAVDLLKQVAHFMAGLPLASFTVNPQAVPFLWVVAVSLLLAFLFKRWALVLVAVVAAFPLIAAQQIAGPAVIVLNGGENIIVSDGHAYKPLTQTEDFSDKAFEALTRVLPNPQSLNTSCDTTSCHYATKVGGLLVAAPNAPLTNEDCMLNNWVITPEASHFTCPTGAKVYSPKTPTGFKVTATGLVVENYPTKQAQRSWAK